MEALYYHAANFVSTEYFKKTLIYILAVCKAGITCDRYKQYTSLTDNNATLLSQRKATFYLDFN